MKKIIVIGMIPLVYTFSYSAEKVYAKVNNENITITEINKRLWLNYANKTIQEIINEKLILQEAKKNKIEVSKEAIEQKFSNILSNFKDKNEFLKQLKEVNFTEKEYKEYIKNQLLIDETLIKLQKIQITDEDAKNYFQANSQQFKRPETAKIRQILVKTKQEADDAYIALQSGANFEKLSSLKSIDENLRKSGGDLGYITKGMLLPEIEKEVFSLKIGETTKPIQVADGWTIIKLEDLKPAGDISFEEIKEDLKRALLNQILNQKKSEFITELRSKAKIEIK